MNNAWLRSTLFLVGLSLAASTAAALALAAPKKKFEREEFHVRPPRAGDAAVWAQKTIMACNVKLSGSLVQPSDNTYTQNKETAFTETIEATDENGAPLSTVAAYDKAKHAISWLTLDEARYANQAIAWKRAKADADWTASAAPPVGGATVVLTESDSACLKGEAKDRRITDLMDNLVMTSLPPRSASEGATWNGDPKLIPDELLVTHLLKHPLEVIAVTIKSWEPDRKKVSLQMRMTEIGDHHITVDAVGECVGRLISSYKDLPFTINVTMKLSVTTSLDMDSGSVLKRHVKVEYDYSNSEIAKLEGSGTLEFDDKAEHLLKTELPK